MKILSVILYTVIHFSNCGASEAARFRPLALRSWTSKTSELQWIRDQIDGWVATRPTINVRLEKNIAVN